MANPGSNNTEAGADGDVGTAYRLFEEDVRRLLWHSLWVGAGFWLEAAICTEKFVVDFAETLEQKRAWLEHVSPTRWDRQIVTGTWRWSARVARRLEPGARAWRRLAIRFDSTLLERISQTGGEDG